MNKLLLIVVLSGMCLMGQDSFSFGVLGNYETASHLFILRNCSTKVMQITSVRSSCSCAIGKSDFQQIEPGGAAGVECRIDLKSLEGEVSKNFWVRLDWGEEKANAAPEVKAAEGEVVLGGTEGEIVLKMSGTVRSRVKLSGNEAFFKDQKSVEIRLLGYANSATVGKVVVPSDSRFQYSIADGGRRLVISPSGELPNGSWVEQWRLLIDDEKVKELPLRVRSLKVGKIVCIPETLDLRGMRKQVLLRSVDRNADFQVLSAALEPGGLALEASRRGKGRWLVTLPHLDGQAGYTRLVVATDMKGQEKVVVPVMAE